MPESTDPTFYRSPAAAIAAPPEALAYVAALDPAGGRARRHDRGRLRRRIARLRPGGRLGGPSDRGERASPFRLERVLQRALPSVPRPQRRARAPVPAPAGSAF